LQKEKERRAAEEKRIQEGSRLRKQREQLNAELTEVKAQLIKRQSLEEMKALVASYNVIVIYRSAIDVLIGSIESVGSLSIGSISTEAIARCQSRRRRPRRLSPKGKFWGYSRTEETSHVSLVLQSSDVYITSIS
jgi:transposase